MSAQQTAGGRFRMYRNGRSPPGLIYKPCNKTITKQLYHRLPTFLMQRTPIYRNIKIHISCEIIAKLRHLARFIFTTACCYFPRSHWACAGLDKTRNNFDILSFMILRHQLLQKKLSLNMLQKIDNDKLIILRFCLQHIHSLIILWLFIYVCRYISLI